MCHRIHPYIIVADVHARYTVCFVTEHLTKALLVYSGDSEIDQLFMIFRLLGTPTKSAWPEVTALPELVALHGHRLRDVCYNLHPFSAFHVIICPDERIIRHSIIYTRFCTEAIVAKVSSNFSGVERRTLLRPNKKPQ